MNTTHESEENVFIPLKPGKKKRFNTMLAALVPGFVLISASFSVEATTTNGLLLKYFNLAIGIFIIVFNYVEFKKPGFVKWLGVDNTLTLSGLLLIAQGATAFDSTKGFQPSHMLFLAGFISIFKGVMLPDEKVKKGFVVTNEKLIYEESLFSKNLSIYKSDIQQIIFQNESIIFTLKNQKTQNINLKEYQNSENIFHELKKILSEKNL